MMTFTLAGKPCEFDDDHLSNLELRDIKRVTGLQFAEFWNAFGDMDPDCVTAIVWLHLRRDGQPEVTFGSVKFDFMEFMTSFASDKAAEETDEESDPTPPSEPDAETATP